MDKSSSGQKTAAANMGLWQVGLTEVIEHQ